MEQTIITRVGFCLKCHLNQQPKLKQPFLVYGADGYHLRYAGNNGVAGFTPHIYKKATNIGNGDLIVLSACGMYECDVEEHMENDVLWYRVKKDAWKRNVFTVPQWNGLVMWKHDWDYWVIGLDHLKTFL